MTFEVRSEAWKGNWEDNLSTHSSLWATENHSGLQARGEAHKAPGIACLYWGTQQLTSEAKSYT